MKVLLANPPYRIPVDQKREKFFIRAGSRWPFSVEKSLNEHADYIPFPFYLGYAAALLEKENDIETFVEDGVALHETEEEFLSNVEKIFPDIVLFETAINSVRNDALMAKKLKTINPKMVIVLAGLQATALAEETLEIGGDAVDFLMIQEYDQNFRDLVLALRDGQSIEQVNGLAYRKSGKTIKTPPTMIDVNQLPFPARHLFPSNRKMDLSVYWDAFCQYRPAIQMHSSRGCPFQCNFCAWIQVMYDNNEFRGRDPESICDEIEMCVERYGVKEIYFDDDDFTANKNHVMGFCEAMIRRGLNKKVHWSAMCDFIVTDEEMILKMHEAGCIGMKFGVESGNKEVLKKIKKPVKFKRLKENVALCNRLKIKTHATFSFGLINETQSSLNDTMEFARKLPTDTAQFSISTPFPGTRFYEDLKKEGRLKSQSWEDFDGNNVSVVAFEGVNGNKLQNNEVSTMDHSAPSVWLKSKLVSPQWVLRQLYFFCIVMKGQGLRALAFKIYRGWNLITGKV